MNHYLIFSSEMARNVGEIDGLRLASGIKYRMRSEKTLLNIILHVNAYRRT